MGKFKIKNYSKFNQSDVIFFKLFKLSAIALAPSSEI